MELPEISRVTWQVWGSVMYVITQATDLYVFFIPESLVINSINYDMDK